MENSYIANERLLNLIENLLDISRIEAGRLEFDLEPIDLAKSAQAMVDDFQQKAKAKGLKLQFYEQEKAPKVTADAKKISEVISNIIDNAVKYTPAGGKIRISGSRDNRSMSIKIDNSAPHLKKGEMSYLSEPFYRSRDVLETDIRGKGLGLYIARYIVESHKGEMLLHLSDDHIFSVTISLPVQ